MMAGRAAALALLVVAAGCAADRSDGHAGVLAGHAAMLAAHERALAEHAAALAEHDRCSERIAAYEEALNDHEEERERYGAVASNFPTSADFRAKISRARIMAQLACGVVFGAD